MSSKKVVVRGRPRGKRGEGKDATVTETREHILEERAGERHAFNGTAERRSLFTVAHLCSQKETVRGTERRREGGEMER